jgi:excisionase family DNA binding protein
MTGYDGRDFGSEFGQVLDHFLDRLAADLADRVEQRLERLAVERSSDGPQALDVKQAATQLGISDRTMHTLVVAGEIPSVKVGRRRLIATTTIQRLLIDGVPTVVGAVRGRDSGRRRRP